MHDSYTLPSNLHACTNMTSREIVLAWLGCNRLLLSWNMLLLLCVRSMVCWRVLRSNQHYEVFRNDQQIWMWVWMQWKRAMLEPLWWTQQVPMLQSMYLAALHIKAYRPFRFESAWWNTGIYYHQYWLTGLFQRRLFWIWKEAGIQQAVLISRKDFWVSVLPTSPSLRLIKR